MTSGNGPEVRRPFFAVEILVGETYDKGESCLFGIDSSKDLPSPNRLIRTRRKHQEESCCLIGTHHLSGKGKGGYGRDFSEKTQRPVSQT